MHGADHTGDLKVKCSRCQAHYHVPIEKAGKRGRCPKCGGMIHVPEHVAPEEHHPQPTHEHHHGTLWVPVVAMSGVALLIVLVAIWNRGGAGGSGSDSSSDVPASERVRQIQQGLQKARVLEAQLGEYAKLRDIEQQMRARQILAKAEWGRPVSEEEQRFREQVLAEYARRGLVEGGKEDWQLNAPLPVPDHAKLESVYAELRQKAADIRQMFSGVDIAVNMKSDALGREALDVAALRTQLASLSENLESRLAAAQQTAGSP